jgi:hypothetical protein
MSRMDQKHHYIPVFYLKRWGGDDGQLCELSRPHKMVVPRRTHPDGTGYIRGLYRLEGLAPGYENIVEVQFLKATDDAASQALTAMIQGQEFSRPVAMKTAWSRFLMSLLLRHPEALEKMKEQLRVNVQNAYELTRKPDAPKRFEDDEELAGLNEVGRLHGSLLIDLVQDSKLGRSWNTMVWSIASFSDSDCEFLTSDRPLVMNGFPIAGVHMSLPVSPSKMFFASETTVAQEQFKTMTAKLVARAMNDAVAKQAVKFVYARTDRSLRFVENRLGRFVRPPVDF